MTALTKYRWLLFAVLVGVGVAMLAEAWTPIMRGGGRGDVVGYYLHALPAGIGATALAVAAWLWRFK